MTTCSTPHPHARTWMSTSRRRLRNTMLLSSSTSTSSPPSCVRHVRAGIQVDEHPNESKGRQGVMICPAAERVDAPRKLNLARWIMQTSCHASGSAQRAGLEALARQGQGPCSATLACIRVERVANTSTSSKRSARDAVQGRGAGREWPELEWVGLPWCRWLVPRLRRGCTGKRKRQ